MFLFHVQVTGEEVPHEPSWLLPLQVYVVLNFLLVLRTYHDVFENKMVRFFDRTVAHFFCLFFSKSDDSHTDCWHV